MSKGPMNAADQPPCATLSGMLLIDAANVVGSRPTGWWRDRPGAARQLLARLRTAADTGRLSERIVVVLEGAARAAADPGSEGRITVVHAPRLGDDTLVEMARTGPPPVTLVSADRELRRRVAEVGGSAVGPSWLWERLDS